MFGNDLVWHWQHDAGALVLGGFLGVGVGVGVYDLTHNFSELFFLLGCGGLKFRGWLISKFETSVSRLFKFRWSSNFFL